MVISGGLDAWDAASRIHLQRMSLPKNFWDSAA
jgi:hypothetical protein